MRFRIFVQTLINRICEKHEDTKIKDEGCVENPCLGMMKSLDYDENNSLNENYKSAQGHDENKPTVFLCRINHRLMSAKFCCLPSAIYSIIASYSGKDYRK